MSRYTSGSASADSPSRQCGTMIAPTTRTGRSPAVGSTGCSTTDASSELDISATTSATVSRVTRSRDHVSRSASSRAVNSVICDSNSSTRTGAAASRASNSSNNEPVQVASSTATVETGRTEHSPIRVAATHVPFRGSAPNSKPTPQRRHEGAVAESWPGEIEGIDLTLRFLRDKRTQAQRLQRITRNVDLGLPAVRATKQS
ncbi:hypothetical protein [Streptomyces sp. OE57]|uniref:hypothetical protein n=1 Tax=Streptomyces lacaronensis TaxID=3379885 RepID=UPI0039B792BE